MRHGYLQLGQTGERIPRNLSVKLVKVSFRDVLTSDFFFSLEDSSTAKVTVLTAKVTQLSTENTDSTQLWTQRCTSAVRAIKLAPSRLRHNKNKPVGYAAVKSQRKREQICVFSLSDARHQHGADRTCHSCSSSVSWERKHKLKSITFQRPKCCLSASELITGHNADKSQTRQSRIIFPPKRTRRRTKNWNGKNIKRGRARE